MLMELNQKEREDARQKAIENIRTRIGKRPERENYKNVNPGKYPEKLINLIILFSVIFLVAAFYISAVRVFEATTVSYSKGLVQIGDQQELVIGVFGVLLAEIGVIIGSLSFTIVAPTRAAKGAISLLMLGCTALALIANYEIGVKEVDNPTTFTWAETFLPPIFVLIVAWVLKVAILENVRARFEDTKAYLKDLGKWEQEYNNPERHEAFKEFYLSQINTELKEKNLSGRGKTERQEIMNNMRENEWMDFVLKNAYHNQRLAGMVESFLTNDGQ